MRGPTARALLEDARQQVLDNRVFRLLAVVALILILPTILIGFHEDQIDFLFGWKTLAYKDLFESFGGNLERFEDARTTLVGGLQSVVVQFFGGMIGVIFAIAATAFFVPRMLERGAADVVFSKPVSRMTLLMARYVAGLLFVAVLACVLVTGMYLGLLLRSGYNDPGFLWGALTLIYLYAVLHAFSIGVATMTRSSTAAILLTLVLFSLSGCVHRGWQGKEYAFARTAAEDAGRADEEDDAEETPIHPLAAFGLATLDTLHYALPKTTDADALTDKLKRAVLGPVAAIEDSGGDLTAQSDPRGFELDGARVRDLGVSPARWLPEERGADSVDEITLTRHSREMPDAEGGGGAGAHRRRWTAARAAKALTEELEGNPDLVSGPSDDDDVSVPGARAISVRWTARTRGRLLARERVLFAFGEGLYELELVRGVPESAGTDTDAAEWEQRRDRFLRHVTLGGDLGLDPASWYEKRFRLDAPLKYNPLFSVGSTLAFALLMLLISWLKLRRMDF